jgi:hypothetical protein
MVAPEPIRAPERCGTGHRRHDWGQDAARARMRSPRFPASLEAMDITAPSRTELDEARMLVRRISAWPFVRVDLRGDAAAVRSGVRDTFIARLDLRTGALTVFVLADMVDRLVATEPLLRVTCDGVRLDVSDAATRRAGERVIRWRIDLERFSPQLREASP